MKSQQPTFEHRVRETVYSTLTGFVNREITDTMRIGSYDRPILSIIYQLNKDLRLSLSTKNSCRFTRCTVATLIRRLTEFAEAHTAQNQAGKTAR